MTADTTSDYGAVVYTDDATRLAAFYERVLGANVIEREPTHVTLARGALRLVLHNIPEAYRVPLSTPVRRREDSATKLAFAVDSIAGARELAAAHGGVIDDASKQWSWSGRTVCDGHDPDGNVLQLWER